VRVDLIVIDEPPQQPANDWMSRSGHIWTISHHQMTMLKLSASGASLECITWSMG
jgi:hypothetical protein